MRVSLQVDDKDTPASLGAPDASTPSAAGHVTDVDAGPASGDQAALGGARFEAAGDDRDRSVSSPGAEDTGGARETEEAPGGGGIDSGTSRRRDGAGQGIHPARLRAGVELLADVDENLQDIGVASFGPPQEGLSIESIIGTDDRVQITNTAVYPWRVHCSLRITARDGSQWIGTGWFIGPHTLITAGHCVFIKNSGVPGRDGWVRSITVIPGRNGAAQPFGSVVSSNFAQ